MIDHVGINRTDLAASAAFCDRVLATPGYRRVLDVDVAIGYGVDSPDSWIGARPDEGPASGPNREIHVGFEATDAAAVHASFDAAVELGAELLHEPRLWPEYHDACYGAFVRDPDGNNVEACCHTGAP